MVISTTALPLYISVLFSEVFIFNSLFTLSAVDALSIVPGITAPDLRESLLPDNPKIEASNASPAKRSFINPTAPFVSFSLTYDAFTFAIFGYKLPWLKSRSCSITPLAILN